MTDAKRTALPNGEKALYERIRELIINARQSVSRGVDLIQVHTNFEIGRRIVEQEQKGKGRAEYGEEIIKALASRLTDEFGRGFSASNLAYMRTFFLLYQDRTVIFQTASGKLTRASKTQIRTDQAQISQTMSGKLAPRPGLPRPFTLSWSHYFPVNDWKIAQNQDYAIADCKISGEPKKPDVV
jgi:hypothetical protein